MRFVVALVAALAVAAAPGGASRAGPPAGLFVFAFDTTPGVAAETDVDLSLPAASSVAIVSVTQYLPAGYTVAVGSAPGTAIGDATIILDGRADPFSAGLFTADPTTLGSDPCAPGTHTAVWTAVLDAFPLTIFVDPTAGDETARGAYKLVYCLPAFAGGRVVDVDLDLRRVLTNPASAGLTTWRAFVKPEAGAAFEVRSLVALPQTLTFEPSFRTRTNALTVSGRLVAGGAPRPEVNVHVAAATRPDLSDARELGVARTRADGSYSLTRPFARKRTKQRLTLIVYVNFYVGDCSDPSLLPGGCAGQSIAPPPAHLATLTIPGLSPKLGRH